MTGNPEVSATFAYVPNKETSRPNTHLGLCTSTGAGYRKIIPRQSTGTVRAQIAAMQSRNMGYMFDTGRGVQKDFAQALSWYQKAAKQNNREAQCGIGAMYYEGRGVQKDWVEAALWYRRAAENGQPHAQYDLGYMYYYGQGVAQDREEARRWIQRAAEQGDLQQTALKQETDMKRFKLEVQKPEPPK
jgi:hypothetical protein